MEKKKKLSIDRSKWVRGGVEEYGESLLLNDLGSMCCLGFYCVQVLGLEYSDIKGLGDILGDFICNEVKLSSKHAEGIELEEYEDDESLRWKYIYKKSLGCMVDREISFLSVNDDEELSEEERERKLTELFSEIGVEVEFFG